MCHYHNIHSPINHNQNGRFIYKRRKVKSLDIKLGMVNSMLEFLKRKKKLRIRLGNLIIWAKNPFRNKKIYKSSCMGNCLQTHQSELSFYQIVRFNISFFLLV